MDSYAKGHCAGFQNNKNSFCIIFKLLYSDLFGLCGGPSGFKVGVL